MQTETKPSVTKAQVLRRSSRNISPSATAHTPDSVHATPVVSKQAGKNLKDSVERFYYGQGCL